MARSVRRTLAAVLVGALLLEGGLRLLLGNFAQSDVLMRSDDPDVCLELRPGVDVEYTGWLRRVAPTRMRVSPLGNRGDAPDERAPGALRILAVGDSFTFGQGVEEDETFLHVLGDQLRARGAEVEVLNFGVPGHGTPQSVALARRLAATLQPDLVLVHVFTNDLSAQDSYCTYGRGGNEATRTLLRHWYTGRLAWLLTGPLRAGDAPQAVDGTPPERFVRALTTLRDAGGRGDFLTAAVLLTDREDYAAAPWCDGCTPAHDLVGETGVHVVDLSGPWRSLVEHPDRYFLRGEEHLTPAGNRLVGEALAAKLGGWIAFEQRLRQAQPPTAPR